MNDWVWAICRVLGIIINTVIFNGCQLRVVLHVASRCALSDIIFLVVDLERLDNEINVIKFVVEWRRKQLANVSRGGLEKA